MGFLTFLMLPAALAGGWYLGIQSARRIVREELDSLRSELRNSTSPAVSLAAPSAAPAELQAPAVTTAAPASTPAPAPEAREETDPRILAVISAAVAAYLGKAAHIRYARVIETRSVDPWAQQGRVTIQASHALRR